MGTDQAGSMVESNGLGPGREECRGRVDCMQGVGVDVSMVSIDSLPCRNEDSQTSPRENQDRLMLETLH